MAMLKEFEPFPGNFKPDYFEPAAAPPPPAPPSPDLGFPGFAETAEEKERMRLSQARIAAETTESPTKKWWNANRVWFVPTLALLVVGVVAIAYWYSTRR
jgi:hypothetical protein